MAGEACLAPTICIYNDKGSNQLLRDQEIRCGLIW
jgi:hypothetical protein